MLTLGVGLLVLAAALLVAGGSVLVLSPRLAARVASTSSRPRLERRGSGPDRMRALITAQRSERRTRAGLSVGLRRTGIVLAGAAALSLVAGLITWLTGS